MPLLKVNNLEYFLFAKNNIKRKKLKNLLTIISIAVGVISITIISIISSTGTLLIENELNTLGLNGISISYNNSAEHLKNDDSRDKIALGQAWRNAAGSQYRYYMVFRDGDNLLPGAVSLSQFIETVKAL